MKHFYLKLLLVSLSLITKQLYSQTPGTMDFGTSTVVISYDTNPYHNYSTNSLPVFDNEKLNGFDVSATTSGDIFLAFALNGNSAGTSIIGDSTDAVLSWIGNGVSEVNTATLKTNTGIEIGITSMHFAYELASGSAPSNFTITGKRDGAIVGTLILNSPPPLSDLTLNLTTPTTGSFTNIDEIIFTPSTPIFGGWSIDDIVVTSAIASNTPPAVNTTAASAITDTYAILGGDVTSDGGNTVTERGIVYAVTTTNADPIIGGIGVTKHIIGAGTGSFSQLILSLNPNTNYSYKAYAVNSEGTSYGALQNFTTQKTNQTITFDPLSNKTYGDSSFNLTATASSGLPVSYVSSNTAVATIVGNTVNIIGAGTTDITASQTGDATYNAAPNVLQQLTINKATLTVTADDKSREYGDPNPMFTNSYSGFKNGEDTAVLTTTPTSYSTATTTTNVGTVDIYSAGGLDDNYDFTYVKGTLTINKATLTVTADDKSREYGDLNPMFTNSYSGFKNGEDAATLTIPPTSSSTATTTTNVGTVDIAPAGGVNDNYDFTYVKGTLTINKATLTVTADDKSREYGDPNPMFTNSYSGFKNGEDTTVLTTPPTSSSTATTTTNVGTVDIDPAGGLDDNYDFIYTKGTLTINKATLTVTADNKSKGYGDPNPVFTNSYSGFKNGEDTAVLTTPPTSSSTATTTTNVGTVDIDPAGGLDDNYDFIYVKGTLTINKATLTVTADDKSKTYGDANPIFTYSYSGFKNGENEAVLTTVPTASSTATVATHVGTIAIDVAGGMDDNYSFAYTNGTLTIGKAVLIVEAAEKTKIYGDDNPILTFNYLASSFKNGDTYLDLNKYPKASTTATKFTNVGTATITLSEGEADNYDFSYTSATLTITKAPLTATADDKSREYGDANPAFTVSYAGFKNSETASVLDSAPTASSTATNTTNVGTEAITLSAGTDNNYTITSNNGTLTINKAILLVTAKDTTVEYGENFSIDFEYGPFKNGEDASVLDTGAYVYIPVDYTNAGTYTIIPDALSDNNYMPNYVNGTLTKTKATVNVMATANSKTYGDVNPALTFTYGTFKNGETADVIDTPPTASSTATTSTDVGTASITVSGGVDNNYTFNYTSADLTINKATLTATADDKTKFLGQDNPDFTITYSGFKNSETAAVLDTEPIANSTATNETPVGTSTITVTGGTDNNYKIEYVNGTLTILAGNPVPTNDISQKKKYGFSPNDDGINDTWTIEGIDIYANNIVKVYNRAGKKVFEQKAYNNTWNGVSNTSGNGEKLPVGPYIFEIELNQDDKKPVKGWLYINY